MKSFQQYLDESTGFDRPKFIKYLLSNGYKEVKKNTYFTKTQGNKVCLVSMPYPSVAGFIVLDASKLDREIEFDVSQWIDAIVKSPSLLKQWVDAIVKSPSLPKPSDGFAISKGLEYLKTELDRIENFKI